mmetsp:Transcript_13811/g.23987  ORF Transcript_13811/g.23987 Transcript_13811/m.23987 type:complete len:85 (+) Transcript_13811:517-771(+)
MNESSLSSSSSSSALLVQVAATAADSVFPMEIFQNRDENVAKKHETTAHRFQDRVSLGWQTIRSGRLACWFLFFPGESMECVEQ